MTIASALVKEENSVNYRRGVLLGIIGVGVGLCLVVLGSLFFLLLRGDFRLIAFGVILLGILEMCFQAYMTIMSCHKYGSR